MLENIDVFLFFLKQIQFGGWLGFHLLKNKTYQILTHLIFRMLLQEGDNRVSSLSKCLSSEQTGLVNFVLTNVSRFRDRLCDVS